MRRVVAEGGEGKGRLGAAYVVEVEGGMAGHAERRRMERGREKE